MDKTVDKPWLDPGQKKLDNPLDKTLDKATNPATKLEKQSDKPWRTIFLSDPSTWMRPIDLDGQVLPPSYLVPTDEHTAGKSKK